ncbi:MAG TPA: acylneuraminate cytidylyltransferase family protein [Mobilitalea sp.]|nr:acylneuraminate cytidylyltransferase family protein [Mobilitalea sp.]
MNLLFTICARAGSKGVKSKNIRSFLDYPIVYYTLAAYRLFLENNRTKFEVVDIALNTDSDTLLEQVQTTGIPYHYVPRKEELAGDVVSKTDVIKDTLIEMQKKQGIRYDIVIDLDLTSPLRKPYDIKGTLDALLDNQGADVAFSVTDSRRLPFFNMVAEDEEGFYKVLINKGYVSRQQAPKCYDMNASIYAYRNEFISAASTKKVFDGKTVAWQMKDTAILDIDSEEDYELMQVLAAYFYKNDKEFGEVYSCVKSNFAAKA